MHLINKTLYQKLCTTFGRQFVKIEKPGQVGQFKYTFNYNNTGRNYKLIKNGDSVGEEYRVNCPFCGDTHQRLYINHMWGVADKYTSKPILWLCNCFNENCTSNFNNRVALLDLVFSGNTLISSDQLATEEKQPATNIKVKLPGELVPLDILAAESPNHDAIKWCLARGYDPVTLGTVYGVGFCPIADKQSSVINQRIVVPVYGPKGNNQSALLAWTARKINEQMPGKKWMHSVGPIASSLYGLPIAKHYETIVIVEGPGDKWMTGLNAVALFGKTVNKTKITKIKEAIINRPPNVKSTIVVLLDPNQDVVSKVKRKKHHLLVAAEELQKEIPCPVLVVRLPLDTDPGGLDHRFIWACIRRQADRAGVYVSKKRFKVENHAAHTSQLSEQSVPGDSAGLTDAPC